jgi:hypothetical protein
MTLRYSHLSPAHLRADMERMEGFTCGRGALDASLEQQESVMPR